jgi:glycosyltransferase involved in cell wall biosynthesis
LSRRILYVQYTNPAGYPPLEHSSRILADAGWEVLFLGTGAFGAEALEFPPHERIEVRRVPFCSPGWRQKAHYLRFQFWVMGVALSWKPDWIYASDAAAAPAGWLLRVFGKRVVYHEHDTPGGKARGWQRMVLAARQALIRRAEVAVWPNPERALIAAPERRDAAIVWNCPLRDEVGPPREPRDAQVLEVFYHGSLSASRLPLSVMEALALLPDAVRLTVAGYETAGFAGYSQRLREAAARLGIADRVRLLGPIALRADLLAHCRKADVGLALMPARSGDLNERTMAGPSNKPFDYLACGLAVLVSDLPDWRSLYVDAGMARACNQDDPVGIAAALRWFLAHPEETRTMGERGRRRILEDWNYETQFAAVRERMEG